MAGERVGLRHNGKGKDGRCNRQTRQPQYIHRRGTTHAVYPSNTQMFSFSSQNVQSSSFALPIPIHESALGGPLLRFPPSLPANTFLDPKHLHTPHALVLQSPSSHQDPPETNPSRSPSQKSHRNSDPTRSSTSYTVLFAHEGTPALELPVAEAAPRAMTAGVHVAIYTKLEGTM